MKILGTGLSGLVGSRIKELLSGTFVFEDISLETGADITQRETIIQVIKNSNSKIVLHLAAKTNVDGCEEDMEKETEGETWKINVLGTQNVVDACIKTGKKIIYVSTDFVFDGENCPKEGYSEEDSPNPINWYAKTKHEGEKIVQNSGLKWVIVRLAYPYRSRFERLDFVRTVIDRMQNGKVLQMVTDHIMTPTFIDDIAYALTTLFQKNAHGIYHLVGSEFISPFTAAILIAKTFGFDEGLVQKTTREEYFKNRAKRPFCLKLKNDKIQKLGAHMSTFEEGLLELKNQIGY